MGSELTDLVETEASPAAETEACTPEGGASAGWTQLHSRALEGAANAVLIVERDETIAWVNPAFSQLTGYRSEEAVGQSTAILMPEVHDTVFYEKRRNAVLAGRVWRGETVSRRKDGSLYTELQTITPLRDGRGEVSHLVVFKEDVSERKELEEQFRQAQKMEAVGRLAGWVAHDFNNLLTAILGYTELLLLDTEGEDPRRPDLDAVKGAAERATALTRQLLAFSRRQVLQPKTLDLNRVLSGIEKMLRRLIGEDIELVLSLDPELGTAVADPGQIEQVIMNLAVNAREAMPNGGKLVVETANVELGAAYCATHDVVEPGSYVMVAVSDTGEGIDKETLPSIFEPFFTTKESRLCSGLGLSTVYGIVKQSGGYIWAYSEPGIGSAFKVYLPREEGEERVAAPPLARAARQRERGSETVLVVEDEDDVRRLALRVLREAGYRTLEARNGAEALMVAKEHEGVIALMLTDVIMPLMSGPEAARRQAALRPEMKVLYMSGYTGESIAQQGLLEDETPLLQKPFSPRALLELVHDVLEGAPR